jgi:hypothetical protein
VFSEAFQIETFTDEFVPIMYAAGRLSADSLCTHTGFDFSSKLSVELAAGTRSVELKDPFYITHSQVASALLENEISISVSWDSSLVT